MSKKTIGIIVAVMVIVAIGILAGSYLWFLQKQPEKYIGPVEKVNVQLKWAHQAQFAGIYTADQKGFYAEEGLDVTLIPGKGLELNKVVEDLLSGKTDFAMRGGDEVLTARAKDKPIVAIAIIFQINPWAYATLKDSGIEKPQDFVGKKLMISEDGVVIHQTLMKQMGINPEDVELVTPYEFSTEPLATGQVDAHILYQPSLGQSYEKEGYDVTFIWPGDYGVRFYADTIFTREQMIEEHPEIVEAFLKASLEGWQFAIENPDVAVDFTLEYDSSLNRDVQKLKMNAQIPLIHTGEHEIGWMDRSVWVGMQDMLLEQGILEKEIDVDKVFTMRFLNEIIRRGI